MKIDALRIKMIAMGCVSVLLLGFAAVQTFKKNKAVAAYQALQHELKKAQIKTQKLEQSYRQDDLLAQKVGVIKNEDDYLKEKKRLREYLMQLSASSVWTTTFAPLEFEGNYAKVMIAAGCLAGSFPQAMELLYLMETREEPLGIKQADFSITPEGVQLSLQLERFYIKG